MALGAPAGAVCTAQSSAEADKPEQGEADSAGTDSSHAAAPVCAQAADLVISTPRNKDARSKGSL